MVVIPFSGMTNRWLLLIILSGFGALASAGELVISAVDSSGESVWARFEVRAADGSMFQPASSLRDSTSNPRPGGAPWYIGHFTAKEPARIELPAGEYTVVAERGTEFERFEQQVRIDEAEPAQLQVRLDRWINMNERGWYSADFHVHRPPDDTLTLIEAEDLNLGVVFTMWNKRDLWEGESLPTNPLRAVNDRQLISLLNAEDERGGGAWMFHGLSEKLDLGVPGRWFPIGLEFIERAKSQRPEGSDFPWFDLEKPFWIEAPIVMALSPPDSIGLLHNHFNEYGIHASSAWGRARDEEAFPGNEGFVRFTLDLNYRYWNLGFRIPASAGSASGVLPNPVGYNRLYVKLDQPFGVDALYRELRHGQSFATNGPMLFFDAVQQDDGNTAIQIEVESRDPLDRIEVVANGKVIRTLAVPEGATSYSSELAIPTGNYSWVAVRAFAQNDETIRLAHSQPAWLNGEWDAREDAQYFITWIDDLIEISESETDRFATEQEKTTVLDVYRRARAFYESRR